MTTYCVPQFGQVSSIATKALFRDGHPTVNRNARALARQTLVCSRGLSGEGCPLFAIVEFDSEKIEKIEDEIRASALQFVRKLSGYTHPSKANEVAFNRAVDEVTASARQLLASLATSKPPRDRVIEANKARARAKLRHA